MAGNKYSKLSFDKSKIPSLINNWCEMNLDGDFEVNEKDSAQRISYSITNNSMEIKIDFIKAAGGALTIFPAVGKHQDISQLIAEDIYDHISPTLTKSPYANGFSIKMDYDDFNILVQLLEQYDNIHIVNTSFCNEPGKAHYELYKFKSDLLDSVTLKYFTGTNRLQLQGKPLYLFNEIVSIIGENEENAGALVDAHIEMCKVEVTPDELNDELESILGIDLYNYLTVSQKAFINSSIVLSKINISGLEDYSYVTSQALKAYEGFVKKVMASEGLVLTGKQQLGEFFMMNTSGVDYSMKNRYTSGLDVKKIDIFEQMYNYYNKNRHPYMHGSDSDSTVTVIGDFEKAIEILDDLIRTMKMQYSVYCAI